MKRDHWIQSRAPALMNRRRFLAGCTAAGAVAPAVGGLLPGGHVAAAGSAEQAAGAPQGGSLTAAYSGVDAKSFHPYLTTDTFSATYQGYVYGISLSQRDPTTLQQIPWAATWTVSDDQKTYTFTLKDIKWSDGTPLTTDDFVWTYQQAIKPENQYPYAGNLNLIASYTAQDPRTLIVTLTDALTVGLEAADAITPLPRHIWEQYDWSDPAKNPEIMSPSVVSGMWKLQEWTQFDHAAFVANDRYFDGRPNIDTLRFQAYPSGTAAYQALKAGNVDYYVGIPASDYAEAKTLPNVTVYDWYPAAGTWTYIGFNFRHPALQDVRVRQAIAYAVPRDALISAAMFGLAKPIYAGFVQESPVYDASVQRYDLDPDRARALLSQAGYMWDQDGTPMLRGQPLTLILVYPTSSAAAPVIASYVAGALGALGIGGTIRALDPPSYFSALQSPPYDWDLAVGRWESTIDPYWTSDIWSETSIPQVNFGAYVNPQLEGLFTQASKTFDSQQRRQLYDQIQEILATDLPQVFLFESLQYAGLSNRVGGIIPTPLGIEYNMNHWYVNDG